MWRASSASSIAQRQASWDDCGITDGLARFGDLSETLEPLSVPLVAVDRDGIVVWENEAAVALVGSRMGRSYLTALAPESRSVAEREFARRSSGLRGQPISRQC